MKKIGFGGGCHWCTEAVFQSLIGVDKVMQGYVASKEDESFFSEGVIIEFDSAIISIDVLIEIHLLTHKSTSDHSMRAKYKSAIYTFSDCQKEEVKNVMEILKKNSKATIITEITPFHQFKISRPEIQNYYYSNPEKPFCQMYIDPKIRVLQTKFSKQLNQEKITHLLEANEKS